MEKRRPIAFRPTSCAITSGAYLNFFGSGLLLLVRQGATHCLPSTVGSHPSNHPFFVFDLFTLFTVCPFNPWQEALTAKKNKKNKKKGHKCMHGEWLLFPRQRSNPFGSQRRVDNRVTTLNVPFLPCVLCVMCLFTRSCSTNKDLDSVFFRNVVMGSLRT
ncbi:MAG: hypothetical protein BYD32DRAFT_176705 [Podila humilis]|nr:MAG: hypothetical protein BYD32DRAFT_176705 [Podila humilis]